ncbi:hypothetical protein J0H58_23250 [bacterium]|nr:hypothetical protein [bacterium]
MSFRRDHDAELNWRRWVRAHEAELIAIGIPREVWADRLTWWRFVDHGYHPPASNAREVRFSPDDLPASQQRRLYVFLDSILPEMRYGSSLWAVLRSRFGAMSQSERYPP